MSVGVMAEAETDTTSWRGPLSVASWEHVELPPSIQGSGPHLQLQARFIALYTKITIILYTQKIRSSYTFNSSLTSAMTYSTDKFISAVSIIAMNE